MLLAAAAQAAQEQKPGLAELNQYVAQLRNQLQKMHETFTNNRQVVYTVSYGHLLFVGSYFIYFCSGVVENN